MDGGSNSLKAMTLLMVGYSIRKEIFFIILGSILGAAFMSAPNFVSDMLTGTEDYFFWVVAAGIVGSDHYAAGVLVHFGVATLIGIAVGAILYKTKLANISRSAVGLAFGLLAGAVTTVVFAVPVQHLWIHPMLVHLGAASASAASITPEFLARSAAIHLIWGATLGLVASTLTAKLGTNYRCVRCDIEFSRISTYKRHHEYVHVSGNRNAKKIVIVGGGYAGVGVLEAVQKEFQKDVDIEMYIISEKNFFLHTPMLAELATGTVEPRHIATPIRNFCKRARFYQASVTGIDLKEKAICAENAGGIIKIDYDYLVIAAGTRTGFHGNETIRKHSATIKTLNDAVTMRNRLIAQLELADLQDAPAQKRLLSFLIVGGGFSGVETAGELNEFVRDSAARYYRNIEHDAISVTLVASRDHILPEIGELGRYAADSLTKAGVEILYNARVRSATESSVMLDDGSSREYAMLIWAAGNESHDFVKNLGAKLHPSGRIIVDEYLRLPENPEVFALGDCAYITDPSGEPYPPTAQHAIREASTAAQNIIAAIRGGRQVPFQYSSKGSMAKIGTRDGIAKLGAVHLTGFAAWFVWKQYYLSTLPVMEKRLRVGLDWFVGLFFARDITRLE